MTRSRREPDWRGIAAVILAIGIVAVLLVADVYVGVNPARTVTTEEVATISTVLGAGIGALGGYLLQRPAARPPPPERAPDDVEKPERSEDETPD